MTLIILAAGLGSRLELMTRIPKPLNKLNKTTLLEYNISAFSKVFDIKRCLVVVGYKKTLISDYLNSIQSKYSQKIQAINNPYYIQGNILSLAVALIEIKVKQSLVIINCDHVFGHKALEKLKNINVAKQITVAHDDNKNTLKQGATKVITDQKQVTQISRDLHRHDGEYVGVTYVPSSYMDLLNETVQRHSKIQEDNNLTVETALSQIVTSHYVSSFEISSKDWINVNSKDELAVAQKLF